MTITAQQLVDVVRLLCYPGVFMLDDEILRTENLVQMRKQRYDELKRTTSFEDSDLIATSELVAQILGVGAEGIETEVRERSRRQIEA